MILSAAVLAISCEDPGKIGLIINADNGLVKTHYFEMVLPTSVVQFNPRKTSETGILKAGQFVSSDFGRVFANSYTQLNPSTVIEVNTNAEYVGFEMTIGFSGIKGSTPINTEEQTISIYQAAEEIDTDINYYRNDQLALGPKLADWTFEPLVEDTLTTDSTYILLLNDVVGADLFSKLKAADPIFDDDDQFNAYFKGIAFMGTSSAINIFDIDRSKFKLSLKYNEFNTNGTAIPRTYVINLGTAGFYQIDSDKSGTPLSGLNPDNTEYLPTDNNRYLQYGTTMAIRADLTPFYNLTDTLQNMIINKALITIGRVKSYGDYNKPPDFLYAYFTDETNEWPIVDDAGRNDSSSIGNYFVTLQDEESQVPPGVYQVPQVIYFDQETKRYKVDISLFFQQLYSGGFSDANPPFLEEKGQVYFFGETDVLFPNRRATQSTITNMVVHQDSIRLRIHYTIPNLN